MSKLLVLSLSFLLVSCSSFGGLTDKERIPGYRFGKQLDNTALRSSFIDR